MHLVSWNVNGIRAILKKEFIQDIKKLNPDILCLQETKGQSEEIKSALELMPDFKSFINCAKEKKGYSGTAILTRHQPDHVYYDLGMEEFDAEGRVITAEFKTFYLITVYTPNSGEGMKRLSYRAEWDKAFREYVAELDKKKPVIICGDLNVAHKEIDLARPKANYNKTSGYTQTEIDGLDNLLNAGFIDTFRFFYPTEEKFSWWNYKFQARERNVGWRIDYFLVSTQLQSQLKDATIYNECFGSDHCPVGLDIDINP